MVGGPPVYRKDKIDVNIKHDCSLEILRYESYFELGNVVNTVLITCLLEFNSGIFILTPSAKNVVLKCRYGGPWDENE